MTTADSNRRRTLRILGLASAIAVAACGSSFESSGGSGPDSGDDSSDGNGGVIVVGGDDGGLDAADAKRDAPHDGRSGDTGADATSPMDTGVAVDSSHPTDGGTPETGADSGCTDVPGTGAYVEVGSGFSPPNCGSASAPCSTVQAGIDYAGQQGLSTVYVADGVYDETITVSGALAIRGGWTLSGTTWRRDCPVNASTTSIHAPAGETHAVLVTAASGAVELDSLTIDNMNTAAAGQTLYGIFAASGASLDLREVVIDVAAGGAGATGGPGGPAGATPTSCNAGPGGGGGPGTPGNGAAAGSYTSSGYVQSTGTGGGTGLTGGNGTAAPMQGQSGGPTCISGTRCVYQFMVGCVMSAPYDACGTVGSNGCGGLGSTGGGPGTAGGSSVGIFAWGTQVTLDGAPGAVTVGNGGNGGNGGAGGTGFGAGSVGGAGQQTQYDDCLTCTSGGGSTCNGGSCTYGQAGKAGGNGGNGGMGGQGGGGSGGDSYCYVTGGGATVTSSWPPSFCAAGTAGLGGDQGGGASQGAAGHAGVHN